MNGIEGSVWFVIGVLVAMCVVIGVGVSRQRKDGDR